MGFMGKLAGAVKAPVRAMNKLPGMGAVNKAVGKAPGMGAMQGAMGIGPSMGGGAIGNKFQGMAQAGGALGGQMGMKPQPMPEIPNGGMNMETRDAPMPQDMGQMRPQGSMEAGPIDERLAQKRAEMGGQAFDSHMAQQLAARQQAGQPQMGPPQMGGGAIGRALQSRMPQQQGMMGQQRGGGMGRAMGGAMGKMFGR